MDRRNQLIYRRYRELHSIDLLCIATYVNVLDRLSDLYESKPSGSATIGLTAGRAVVFPEQKRSFPGVFAAVFPGAAPSF